MAEERRWRWHHIPDRFDPTQTYLSRLHLLRNRWFGVYVHHIRLPDRERALHDHPWAFVSLILRGGYVEELPDGHYRGAFPAADTWHRRLVSRRPGSIHRMPADGLHRIRTLADAPCWTLIVRGRREREWGFSLGPNHWEPADQYLDG